MRKEKIRFSYNGGVMLTAENPPAGITYMQMTDWGSKVLHIYGARKQLDNLQTINGIKFRNNQERRVTKFLNSFSEHVDVTHLKLSDYNKLVGVRIDRSENDHKFKSTE